MNLHFGILWIEDQASEAEIERIEHAVLNAGFEAKIERIESPEEIEKFSKKQHHYQEYDLILLDLRLGSGIHGDDLAPVVRAAFRSTPILFYSAEDETSLRQKMAKNLVEGVYCIHRDRLTARVGEIVSHLAPALNRLSSMRGLAARVVAECDQDFRAILCHWANNGHNQAILDSLKSRVKESSEKQTADLEKYSDVESLLGSSGVHSAALFNETRDRAGEIGGDDARDIVRGLRKNYLAQVILRRNTLAHALEEQTDEGWKIHRPNAAPLTVSDFERYRREFLTQLRDVRRLREFLLSQ